jgi:hypothetical protein
VFGRIADFQESDQRFHLKSIDDFSLGDHHPSAATALCGALGQGRLSNIV